MVLSPNKAKRIAIAALSSLFAVPLLLVGSFVVIMAKFGHAMSGAGAGSDPVIADAEYWREIWFAVVLIGAGLCLSIVAVWGWLTSRSS